MKPLEGSGCFLLLLLVAELLPRYSYGNNPLYEGFLNKHRDDPKSNFHGRYCDTLMRRRGLTTPQCKRKNTFIHSSKNKIRAVCGEEGVPHGDPHRQLRRSQQHFRVTTCTLRGGSTRPPCEYNENTSPRYIVISCEGGWPTHYEEGEILTTV